jgi:hypothetical protein
MQEKYTPESNLKITRGLSSRSFKGQVEGLTIFHDELKF